MKTEEELNYDPDRFLPGEALPQPKINLNWLSKQFGPKEGQAIFTKEGWKVYTNGKWINLE